MKLLLRQLKMGDRLIGKVDELITDNEVIISFMGDLLRVHNETRVQFVVGQRVMFEVRAIEPLRFQVVPDRREQRRRGQIDISI